MAQQEYELTGGWVCRKASDVSSAPSELSQPGRSLEGWMPAVVPGTVLTTMLQAHLIPDPFFGMNNKNIPDIYTTGRGYYTYWFVKDFTEKAGGVVATGDAKSGGMATGRTGKTVTGGVATARVGKGEHVWLQFRGVNYGYDVYLNGHRLADSTHYGMFLRANYDITRWLAPDGRNRLAVIVYPPDPPGNPNGGQGGDGTIARSVMHQYVVGWDWIQPIRDRNTGIWDKVLIRKTGMVKVGNPHIITLVPGRRQVEGSQAPALIKVSAELTNSGDAPVSGLVYYELEGHRVAARATLAPHVTQEVRLPDYSLAHPRLWWPNGYGAQVLYHVNIYFAAGQKISDEEQVTFGVREIQATWNARTHSRQIAVNGQRIFIKGGNWIVSDAMLRLSKARYDAEIRFHRDMRLNLIRVWGGALTERPEF
jgi:mannosylglycoprotein endo-beta-mannosidase